MEEGVLDRLLGPLERAVMNVIWTTGPVTVREVHAALSRDREIAYTTVLTVMQRLAQKDVLLRDTRATRHVYLPRLTARQYIDESTRRDIDSLLSKYGDLAITNFVKMAASVRPDLIEKLRQIASRHDKKTGR